MTKKSLLKVNGLKKYFPVKKGLLGKTAGYVKAVDDISFYVNEGETLGIVGESGCGKSTTGRMLMRLLEPTEGTVEFDGQELMSLSSEEMRKVRRDIQMVFQDPYASLNPRHTIERILSEPLLVHGMKSAKERKKKVHEFLEVVGLSSFHAKRYPHQFSGGQRQRIGIARALMTNPKLIIADEPVSALDVSIQAQVLNLMQDLQEEFNLTYIFIAHDLGVVRHISDRVGVMYLGKMVEVANSEQLYEKPLHPYTQALLSAVPVPDPDFSKEEVILEGDMPNPANPPSGCTFNPRCPFKMDICTQVVPTLLELEEGHSVACHLYSKESGNDIKKWRGQSMKKGKLWLFAVMLLLVLSTVLAACSGGGDKDGDANGKDDDTGKSEETNKDDGKDEGTDDSGESSGGTLVFGRGGDSTSLDPSRTTEGETFKVTINIFETLLTFEDEGTAVEPGLAKTWEPSEDGLTYTFELQEGVKFHDGTDFNAEAVVKNFERWANGNSDLFPYYNSMFGGFKGDDGHVIESVTAEGDSTVVFKLTRPQAPFLKNLAMDMFAIASPTAFEEQGDDSFERNPVGTGPFKFVDWKPNDSITIEKFDDYWQAGLPKLDKVIFRSIPDNTARLNALTAGEIDLADGINPSDGVIIEGNADLQLFERPSMNVGYLGLTVTRKPFDNKLVRQAMNHAIDKQSIIDAFFEGRADIAVNPMPPSISGYNDEIEGYAYDPEKAKELLEEAGYGDGFEMELWAMPVPRPYMPDGEKVAEVIQKNLADIGITAKIVSHEWATYLDLAEKGEADAFMLGWTGDNGDPDNFLYVLLDEDNIGSNNYTYFKNDQTHDLFIQAQTEVDEDKRIALYKEAQEILHEEAPWVPLAHSTPLLAGIKEITGFLPHPTGSDLLSNVAFE